VLRTAFAAVGVTAVIVAFLGVMYLRYANDTTGPPAASCCGWVVVAVRDIPAGTPDPYARASASQDRDLDLSVTRDQESNTNDTGIRILPRHSPTSS